MKVSESLQQAKIQESKIDFRSQKDWKTFPK